MVERRMAVEEGVSMRGDVAVVSIGVDRGNNR